MDRYAIISNDVVVNIVSWDGDGDIFNGYDSVKIDGQEVGIGWLYVNGRFEDPNAVIPPDDSELYEKELTEINEKYEKDKSVLASAYLNAGLFDGAQEQQKKNDIYQKLLELNAGYDQQIAELDEKYGG